MNPDTQSILVGLANGLLFEFSLNHLLVIKTISLHDNQITKILLLSSGELMSCSLDGLIKFPLIAEIQLKISEKGIHSVTQLSDKSIACSCVDGLKIIPCYSDYSLISQLNLLSSNIRSVSRSSIKVPQIISLLQNHSIQTFSKLRYQSINICSPSLSLLPNLYHIKQSYLFEDQSKAKKRIFSKNYILDSIDSKPVNSKPQSTLTHFKDKLKIFGAQTNNENPLANFKIEAVKKTKWIFFIDDEILFEKTGFCGQATAFFLNGYLKCFIINGKVVARSSYKATLMIDGTIKEMREIESNGIVVTSDSIRYLFNNDANMIYHD